jgi:hypothetical protein
LKRKILALTLMLVAIPLLASGMLMSGFKALLSGAEVMPPVKTEASGGAIFDPSPDGKYMHFNISVKNLSNATAAHIYLKVKGKEDSPVVALYPFGSSPKFKEGKFSGIMVMGIITAANLEGPLKGKPLKDFLQEIYLGKTYLQINTKQHPQGELRGLIVRRPT